MVYIGLHIVDATGHEAELEQFIRENCIYENPDLPHEVAYRTKNINIYVNRELDIFENLSFDQTLNDYVVDNLPFVATPIGYEPPFILLVSTVNFVLEFRFNNELVRLLPTEYMGGVPSDTELTAIATLIRRGCLRAFGLEDSENWYWGDFNRDFNLDFDAEHQII